MADYRTCGGCGYEWTGHDAGPESAKCPSCWNRKPADPAQSAPSAEQRARLFAKSAMDKMMHSPEAWEKGGIPAPYFPEEYAVEMLVEFSRGETEAAAIRTAQLERELRLELKKVLTLADEETVIGGIRNLAQAHVLNKSSIVKLETKLETAESALREAREKAIQECANFVEACSEDDYSMRELASALRALLTVAAQTPEERSR